MIIIQNKTTSEGSLFANLICQKLSFFCLLSFFTCASVYINISILFHEILYVNGVYNNLVHMFFFAELAAAKLSYIEYES